MGMFTAWRLVVLTVLVLRLLQPCAIGSANCRLDLSRSQTETIPTKSRSRSTTAVPTKGRRRQLSRGSTTSIHSAATYSIQDQVPGSPAEYPKQWFEDEHQQRLFGAGHVTAEDMVMQSASQLQEPREYGIDPALGSAVHHSMGYSQDTARRSLPAEGYGTSFMGVDSPMLEGRSDELDDVDSLAGGNGTSKKSSKSSAANELEMRQLFHNNKTRTLPEVATELHGNERGPQSERTRQVFAMLWYVLRQAFFKLD